MASIKAEKNRLAKAPPLRAYDYSTGRADNKKRGKLRLPKEWYSLSGFLHGAGGQFGA